jgi:hypothetical protein
LVVVAVEGLVDQITQVAEVVAEAEANSTASQLRLTSRVEFQ